MDIDKLHQQRNIPYQVVEDLEDINRFRYGTTKELKCETDRHSWLYNQSPYGKQKKGPFKCFTYKG